jgi:hypothetical protein
MTTTITAADLRNMFARYCRALEAAGMNPPEGFHVGLDEGSKLYGRAFRLYVTGDRVDNPTDGNHYPNGSGHARPPAGPDYLGMTKREAYDTLATIAHTLEDVAYARDRREATTND